MIHSLHYSRPIYSPTVNSTHSLFAFVSSICSLIEKGSFLRVTLHSIIQFPRNLIMAKGSDEMRQYREAFSLFDKDHDDIIAPQELGVVLRSCGLSPSEADLQKIQQQVGRKIDFDTFVKVAQNFKANNRETEDDIREAFRVFDKDGTGYVSVAELKHAMISLGERLSEEEVDELIREADIDADGRCNCEDLVRILTNKQR